jgi:hypothetical protein
MRFEVRYLAVFRPTSVPTSILGAHLASAYLDVLTHSPSAAFVAGRLDPSDPLVDELPGQPVFDHRVADGLECQRPEVFGGGVAVKPLEGSER